MAAVRNGVDVAEGNSKPLSAAVWTLPFGQLQAVVRNGRRLRQTPARELSPPDGMLHKATPSGCLQPPGFVCQRVRPCCADVHRWLGAAPAKAQQCNTKQAKTGRLGDLGAEVVVVVRRQPVLRLEILAHLLAVF